MSGLLLIWHILGVDKMLLIRVSVTNPKHLVKFLSHKIAFYKAFSEIKKEHKRSSIFQYQPTCCGRRTGYISHSVRQN